MLRLDTGVGGCVVMHWRGQQICRIYSDNNARLSFDAPQEIRVHHERLAPSDLRELTIEDMRDELMHARHTISALREELERAHHRSK